MAAWRMKARRQLSWAQAGANTALRTIEEENDVQVVGVVVDEGEEVGEVVG
jgi:hypothetical protein